MDYDPVVKYHLAMCYYKTGKSDWGYKMLCELLGDGKLPSDKHKEAHDIVIIQKAMDFYNEKRFDDAMAIFLEMQNNNPNDRLAQFYIGMCYFGLGNVNKAIDIFRELIGRNDIDDDTRDVCNTIISRYEEAISSANGDTNIT